MSFLRAQWILGVLLGVLSGRAATARADGGDGVGFGLVIGYSDQGHWSLGWEGGATKAAGVLKLSAGGIYRVFGQPQPSGFGKRPEPLAIHYLALEPWLLVGGTIGIAVTEEPEVRVAYGVWEGFPIPIEGELTGGDNSDDIHPEAWLLTFAFGFRGFGSFQQFYFTPKIWRFSTLEFNS